MRQLEAVIFDTDGVVTQTAAVHFAAWKSVFDGVLATLAEGDAARPFTDADYRAHVDGIPRYDGVDALLRSRGISLPLGEPTDLPGTDTVCAIGNAKNEEFTAEIDRTGVEPYVTTRRFVELLRSNGIATAVISASKNCRRVLAAASMTDLFDATVDGNDAVELGLAGKPEPDVFIEAARRLGVDPSHAAIIEDAVSGVQAGKAGAFGWVVGLDRTLHPEGLARFAHIVVPDLSDLAVGPDGIVATTSQADVVDLPHAVGNHDITRKLAGRTAAVFLDYDGTLTPIVDRPEDALLASGTRDVLERLGESIAVGIISGRDLGDVTAMVDTTTLWFAGSHGFDVLRPDGEGHQFDEGRAALPQLDLAEQELGQIIGGFPGAWVERKRFAIAIHYRALDDALAGSLESAVVGIGATHDELRVTGGKKIFELRPAVDWNKGKALRWLMGAAGLDPSEFVPIYIGDDVTDEDAFEAIRADGIAIVAATDSRPTAAHFRVDDTDEVRVFLEWLLEQMEAS